MYVADMSLEEAQDALDSFEVCNKRNCKQCAWDIEDLEGRIAELS